MIFLPFLLCIVKFGLASNPGTLNANSVQYEFFTAASDMEILHKVEKKLGKRFLKYVKAEEKRLNELERYIREIEQTLPPRTLVPGKEQLWVTGMSNSYGILKRFTKFWNTISKYSKTNSSKKYMEKVKSDIERLRRAYPSQDDLRGALAAVFRIQDTYDISPAMFINGLDKQSHILTMEEIFEIGFLCVGVGDYYHSQKWFKEALYRFPPEVNQVGFLDRLSLIEYLAWSEYQLGNLEDALKHTRNIVKLNPAHPSAKINLELFQNDLDKAKSDPTIRKKFKVFRQHWEIKYAKLCKGEEEMEQDIKDKLFCKYSQHRPRFILKPLKMEFAYNDPEIIIYHDLLRDHEMEHIKKKSIPLLNRATVHHPETNQLVYADYRVSKSAWIAPEMDEVAANIINKVGDVVNLNMRYSEELQISNYGLAGQYEPHFDHSTLKNPKPFKKYGGNRIATMLMYMSDVQYGGCTVFTNTGPGVLVKPEKGSGVFWYNLLRNGKGNPKTQHAACPVVLGQKWVSNLWIHSDGQEFNRPCSLNKDE